MSVPTTLLITSNEDQFTIVMVDPLPSVLGVSERTRIFKLHNHAIFGTIDGFQQVSKLLHGDNVRFVVAHVDCEVFQRLMAVLGTCWAVSVIIPRLDRQVVSSVNRTTPVVRVFAEPIKSRKDSIFTRLDTPLKKSFANIRGLLRLQEPKTSLFERKGKGSG